MEELKPTESELEILQLLWVMGPSSVREINDELNKTKEVGYTTTLKIMQIMFGKGLVTRTEKGRFHVYRAAVEEESTQKQLLSKFVQNTFGGQAMKMVMQALGNHKASKEELEAIKHLIENLENK
ncbi:BlaI/MecI/CopY family transcriptional regulator [Marinilongibacter aquaticus]|uniref:BlaI/MecI/CopY family transcriptional regulator n=1 Tax=Marinilongibacter aquaticus TaxID=2975157 RepID=UPI0021BD7226|nr:BlaI/MecI/CopY family transcriptional regulator [Marinilongibacter aquaticus]UBM60368.1 BlaI/MecI/CopY family transcriptional regulator [Marinilongibacter aquaticus]